MLIIGDEILSGRTKDKNIGFIADTLTDIGIDLEEVRIVSDKEEAIVEALRALSGRYDFVFTSGGIGPTHDDITADSDGQGVRASDRRRPARGGPADAVLEGPRHRAEREPAAHGAHPGGREAHLELGLRRAGLRGQERLRHGRRALDHAGDDGRGGEDAAGFAPVLSETIEAHRGEGEIAAPAAEVQKAFPGVRIGSYPYHDGERFTTRLVLRSRDEKLLAEARGAMEAALAAVIWQCGVDPGRSAACNLQTSGSRLDARAASSASPPNGRGGMRNNA